VSVKIAPVCVNVPVKKTHLHILLAF
jgi:hypothetical protein